MAEIECNWCHRKVDDQEARELTFFGRKFLLCEEDFQLMWKGFGYINTLCSQLRQMKAKG